MMDYLESALSFPCCAPGSLYSHAEDTASPIARVDDSALESMSMNLDHVGSFRAGVSPAGRAGEPWGPQFTSCQAWRSVAKAQT